MVIRVVGVSKILQILKVHEDKNVPVWWWSFNKAAQW
jgi:hypothetical protein